ncbi:MAG: putative anti-sigma factor antagonist BtrV [Chlamydiia bacterium]|nr:putative anti-sigma factor antagonist BtrV [Chlamydiia bacterium]MCH9615192.1 putative anti-sigma factor antagonist BtrV [Chlamydiia bacterium]MCH9628486.1 putative anti-sigma factor antagonist BtrV [Chlamydiia bacterium]
MSVSLNVVEEAKDSFTILRLEGRLDASSAPLLESKLGEHVKADAKVLVDFAKVDYLSSAGMRLLLSATKKMKNVSAKLIFFSINDEVMEIIKMAGFERILSISGNETEAVNAA